MALEKVRVGFPFVKGVNTKVSEKAQAAGELRDCVNFTVDRIGRLDQRKGFQRYPRDIPAMGSASAGTLDSAKAMGRLGEELVVFDGETAYSKTDGDKWVERGKALNIRNRSGIIHKDMQAASGNLAHGVSGGFEYLVWAEQPFDMGGIGSRWGDGSDIRYRYMVRDYKTGATIVPVTTITTMSTTFEYGEGTGAWPVSGHTARIKLTSSGVNSLQEIGIGDWIQVADPTSSGDTQKRLVVGVVAPTTGTPTEGFLDLNEPLDGTSSAESVYVWKSSGQDALYFAPRIRVLCPVGTDHVYVLLQDGLDLKYYYADTGGGVSDQLELDYAGELPELGRPFPVWDADWILSSDTTVTDSDGARIVLARYHAEADYEAEDIDVYVETYDIGTSGSLTVASSSDYATEDYLPATARRPFVSSGTYEPPYYTSFSSATWQLFLKTIHDEVDGVPVKSSNSKIVVGFTVAGDKSGGTDQHSRIWAFDDQVGDLWSRQLWLNNTGAGAGEILSRAGVGYDATYVYIMGETETNQSGSVVAPDGRLTRPQRTNIFSSRIRLSDGDQDTGDQKALWSHLSVHSDGFVPYQSDTGRCYFWLSAAQATSTLNATLFLADMDGHIHAHGVQGQAPLNKSLEARQQAGDDTVWGSTERIQRNMACFVSRATPGRWSDSSRTDFVSGSSVVDLGATFQDFPFSSPALLEWDTDPERPFRNHEANGVLYVGGGLLWAYDGSRLLENDFLLYPIVEVDGAPISQADTLAEGRYSYYFAYEYRDDNGALHTSRPAGPIIVDITAAQAPAKLQFSILLNQVTNYRFTGKTLNPANYAINIYRTNKDDTRHFLHASLSAGDWGDTFAPNVTRASYVDDDPKIHNDTVDDVAIWDTVNATYAGAPVSSPIEVTRHKDSLLVSNTENVLYSSMGLSTSVAPMFPQIVGENASHFGMFGDGTDSPITHVASNGPTCVFFTRSDGFVFGGEGPDMFGNGEWTRPEKFAPGQGVRPNGFIASTHMGALYSAQSGIYLVGRDLKVTNIGAPMAEYATAFAANDPVVLDDRNEVWIPIWGGDPDSTTSESDRSILVYNYLLSQWYRHEIGGSTFHPGRNVELLGWVNTSSQTSLYLLDSSGYLYRHKTEQDSDPYIDRIGTSGTTYPVSAELSTSWLQVPDYGARTRCYRVAIIGSWGGGNGTTTLDVMTSTNFNSEDYNEFHTVDVTPGGVGLERTEEGSQVVIKPKHQKMESLSLRLVASTSSTAHNVRGWSLEGVLLEIGKRPSTTRFKVGASKVIEGT